MDWNSPISVEGFDPITTASLAMDDLVIGDIFAQPQPASVSSTQPNQGKKKIYKREYARHLDQPILLDKLEFYAKHYKYCRQRFPLIPQEAIKDISSGICEGLNIINWIKSWVRQYLTVPNPEVMPQWRLIIGAVLQSLRIQLEVISSSTAPNWITGLEEQIEALEQSPDLKASLGDKLGIIRFNQLLSRESNKGEALIDLRLSHGLLLYDDLVYFPNFPNGGLVIPYNYLLSVLDHMEARFSFLLYCTLANDSPMYKDVPYLTYSTDLYSILDQHRGTLGNNFCYLAKMLEPLAVSSILAHDAAPGTPIPLLSNLLHDAHAISEHLLISALEVFRYFKKIMDAHHDLGARIVIDQYGQEKLHGYPIIDPLLGITKMREEGTKEGTCSVMSGNWVRGAFAKNYIRGYYIKEGHLPPIEPSVLLHPFINNMYATQTLPSMKAMRAVSNAEWSMVHFQEHQTYDYFSDILDLVDDKAAAPSDSKRHQIYMPDVQKEYNLPRVFNRDETKLLLYLLKEEHIDIKEYFNTINSEKGIPPEWQLILLKMKEREEKLGGRPFSVMHPILRMVASSLERNISQTILKYFGDQTITDSGSALKGRLDDWLRLKDEPGCKWTFFNMDFSNWNYHFREVVTGPTARLLDEIFGTENFKWGPKLFVGARLLYGSPFLPPQASEDTVEWDDHRGGNQGICQKFWTIITQLVIREVLDSTGFKYYLMGSGDNQVLAVSVPTNQDHKTLCDNIIDLLSKNFQEINLVLKQSETWYSTNLLAYQRKYYYKRIALESGIKHSVRAYFGISDIDAGITSQIATSMQSGMVMVEATSSGIVGPVFAYTESLVALFNHPRANQLKNKTISKLVDLTLMTADIGGLPFLQITSFMYAGHRDTLTECLAFFKRLWNIRRDLRPSIVKVLKGRRSEDIEANQLRLVLNPNSACYMVPITPDIVIMNKVEAELRKPGLVRNHQIRDLLDKATQVEKDRLVQKLFTIRPVNLSLFKVLFECTNSGEILALMNRFNSVSSLVNFTKMNALKNEDLLFSSITERCDAGILRYLDQRLTVEYDVPDQFWQVLFPDKQTSYSEFCTHNHMMKDCSFSMRMFLTSDLVGLTPELVGGPFVPAPLEQLRLRPLYPDSDVSHSLLIEPWSELPSTVAEMMMTRGSFRPYIGSKTQDTSRSIRLTNLDHSSAGKRIKDLVKCYAWIKGVGSSEDICVKILQVIDSLAPTLGEQLVRIRPGIAFGNFIHRFYGGGEVTGAFDYSRSHISTQYRISTNRATWFQRKDDDYYLFFQQLYQFTMALLRITGPIRECLNFEINTVCCTYLIVTEPFHIKEGEEFSLLEDLTASTLDELHLEELKEELEWKGYLQQVKERQVITGRALLAGVVAFQMIKPIYRFNYGGLGDQARNDTDGGPQSEFNVTNLRKIGLVPLMKCVLIQLAYHQVLGPGRSPGSVIRLISTHLSRRGSTMRVEPFRGLFEAILTSGNLEEWAQLARVTVPRGELKSGIGLMTMFLNGLKAVYREFHFKSPKYTLIIEVKKSSHNVVPLIRFLSAWGNQDSRMEYQRGKSRPWELVEHWTNNHPLVSLVVTGDIELSYEQARSAIIQEPTVIRDLLPLGLAPTTFRRQRKINHPPFFQLEWTQSCVPVLPRDEDLSMSSLVEQVVTNWPSSSRLNVNQLENMYVLARPGAAGSSGHFKLAEITDRLRYAVPSGSLVVSLAEGSGSMLSCLLHMNPNCRGIYNSLIIPEDFPHSLSTRSPPTDCICACNVSNRICNWDRIGLTSGDLKKEHTWSLIHKEIQLAQYKVSVLTFDMEGHIPEKQQINHFLSCHIREHQYELVVVKTYVEEFKGPVLEVLAVVSSLYDRVMVVKPTSSDPTSTELYLVGHIRSQSAPVDITYSYDYILTALLTQYTTLPAVNIIDGIISIASLNHHTKVCSTRPMTISPVVPGYPHNLKEWLAREVQALFHLLIASSTSSQNTWKITHSMRLSTTRGSDALSAETHGIWTALCYAMIITNTPSANPSRIFTPHELSLQVIKAFSTSNHPMTKITGDLNVRQFFTVLGEFLFTGHCKLEKEHLFSVVALDRLITAHRLLDNRDTLINHPLFEIFKVHIANLDAQVVTGAANRWSVNIMLKILLSVVIPLSQEHPFPLNITYSSPAVACWFKEFDFPLESDPHSDHELSFLEVDDWSLFDIKAYKKAALVINALRPLDRILGTKRKIRDLKGGDENSLCAASNLYYIAPPYWGWSRDAVQSSQETHNSEYYEEVEDDRWPDFDYGCPDDEFGVFITDE